MSADPKAVDVLNWIDGVLQSGPRDDYGCAAYDAVAELIAADIAYDSARSRYDHAFRDGPNGDFSEQRWAQAALRDAWQRRAVALARCGAPS